MAMKVITINLPNQYFEDLAILVNLGFYCNRSEAIRQALSEFFRREADLNIRLESGSFQKLKEKHMNEMLGEISPCI